ncbi:MAG: hypothetical protein KDK99_05830 [Verrucomicrobiales bacterium]|nr:hypothetical protein [Verrucomicrobiales bacterium]
MLPGSSLPAASSVPVRITEGCLPRMWEGKSAVFFANLLSMFFTNDSERRALQEAITFPESYGARLLPILNLLFPKARNLAILERGPDPDLCAYLSTVLGLELPEVRVLGHADYLPLGAEDAGGLSERDWEWIRQLREHPAGVVDGFVTDPVLSRVAERAGKRTLSTVAGSHRGNNKFLLHHHAASIGLPVFETRIAASAGEVAGCLESLKREGYRCAAIKSQIGASGVGLMKMAMDEAGDLVLPDLFFHEGPCLVQGWLEVGRHGVTEITSPSVQMFLDDESVQLYDLTEQILSHDSVHEGNESPPPGGDPGIHSVLFEQAGEAGRWLHQQGYRGTASADFLVTRTARGLTAYLCEINARLTGATYPSLLARHFTPGGGWLMRNLKLAQPTTGLTLLRLLEDHGHLYLPGTNSGILPINFVLNPDDLVEKGQFLCLGRTQGRRHEMLENAERDLPIDWSYVRD